MDQYRLQPQDLPTWQQRASLRVLGLFGWRMLYRPLPGPRGIAVIYPHTSNWDFVVGPFGNWFRSLGGEPVERGTPSGTIKLQAERMHAADWYWLAITPEATRGYRPCWKSGFYHLALEAKMPLALVYIDYPNKTLGVVDHVFLSGDQEADFAAIRAVYEGHHGLYPKNEAPIVLSERRAEPRAE